MEEEKKRKNKIKLPHCIVTAPRAHDLIYIETPRINKQIQQSGKIQSQYPNISSGINPRTGVCCVGWKVHLLRARVTIQPLALRKGSRSKLSHGCCDSGVVAGFKSEV